MCMHVLFWGGGGGGEYKGKLPEVSMQSLHGVTDRQILSEFWPVHGRLLFSSLTEFAPPLSVNFKIFLGHW